MKIAIRTADAAEVAEWPRVSALDQNANEAADLQGGDAPGNRETRNRAARLPEAAMGANPLPCWQQHPGRTSNGAPGKLPESGNRRGPQGAEKRRRADRRLATMAGAEGFWQQGLEREGERCPVARSRGILVRCANRTRFLPTRPSVSSIHRRKPAEGMMDETTRSGRSSGRADSKGRSSRKARQVGGVQRPGVIAKPCRLALRRKSEKRPGGGSPAYIDGAPRERRHKRR